MTNYKLTYFNARGAAEPIRLLFAVAGVPYEDYRFPAGSTGIPADLKPKLPYGQVPVLEFDGTILSQSLSITRFLARKFSLVGANDLEAARIDEIIDAAKDYIDSLRAYRIAKDDETKEAAKKNIDEVTTPKYMGKFNDILVKNGTGCFVGNSVTWADIHVFNLINSTQMDLDQGYPAVQELVKKIGDISAVKAWLEKRPKTQF